MHDINENFPYDDIFRNNHARLYLFVMAEFKKSSGFLCRANESSHRIAVVHMAAVVLVAGQTLAPDVRMVEASHSYLRGLYSKNSIVHFKYKINFASLHTSSDIHNQQSAKLSFSYQTAVTEVFVPDKSCLS